MRHLAIFTTAFVCGFAALWAVGAMTAGIMFSAPGYWAMICLLSLPPLAGLWAFARVFGFWGSRPEGWRFWLAGFCLFLSSIALIFQGIVTPLEALIILAAVSFCTGFIALRPWAEG